MATPIGNLSDITLRALETLKQVDVVACEDTRRTLRLLNAHGISKPLVSCHARRESQAAERICEFLEEGKDVAYASDAGTPGLSDPGAVLVAQVRGRGFSVVPIPGPSAMSAILSIGGFRGKTVTFEGFLSPKSGRRRKRLSELLSRQEAFVIFESPHRVVKLMADIADLEPSRQILVGREMTKLHEQYLQATASELVNMLGSTAPERGEFTVLVGAGKNA